MILWLIDLISNHFSVIKVKFENSFNVVPAMFEKVWILHPTLSIFSTWSIAVLAYVNRSLVLLAIWVSLDRWHNQKLHYRSNSHIFCISDPGCLQIQIWDWYARNPEKLTSKNGSEAKRQSISLRITTRSQILMDARVIHCFLEREDSRSKCYCRNSQWERTNSACEVRTVPLLLPSVPVYE